MNSAGIHANELAQHPYTNSVVCAQTPKTVTSSEDRHLREDRSPIVTDRVQCAHTYAKGSTWVSVWEARNRVTATTNRNPWARAPYAKVTDSVWSTVGVVGKA